MQGCYLLLAQRLNIPIIGTLPTSPWVTEHLIGNPINPIYVPNAWSYTGNKMTFRERVKNMLLTSFIYFWEISIGAIREEIFRRKYFPDIQWSDVKSPALLFLNSHPVLQPRPMVPNAIEIGGAHIKSSQLLPRVIFGNTLIKIIKFLHYLVLKNRFFLFFFVAFTKIY